MNHTPDPVIDEIREVRRSISAGCDHDPVRLVEYLIEFQQQFRDRLVYDPGAQPNAAETNTVAAKTLQATISHS